MRVVISLLGCLLIGLGGYGIGEWIALHFAVHAYNIGWLAGGLVGATCAMLPQRR